jgi:hypothetical protein
MIGAAALALLAAVPATNALRSHSAEAATAQAGDGTTSATAGASCWGIKQQYPASANGTYWLNSAALERPAQFSCDMTTSGGGWVLVGRGRSGWSFAPSGQGSPTTIFTTPDGTGAFSPAALPTATVNALLNGTPVSSLADGIRLERATNTNGSSRQDYRLFPKGADWTWSFDVGQLLNKVVVDGRTYNGSNTMDTASNSVNGQTTNGLAGAQGTDRLFTYGWQSHGYAKGFSFGTGVKGGSNSSTNYLWTSGSEGSPEPFTRVWIRPQVANSAAGFTPIPSGGYPAQSRPAELQSKSERAPWGVVGTNHNGEATPEPYNANVLTMKSSGTTVFVGGRFTGVQQGPTGTQVAQQSLAAFDLDGNWITTFRPQVDGRVWDMLVAPDGNLIVAGDFNSINGVAGTSGIAKLDPTTGAPVAGFKANAVLSGGRPFIRALAQLNGTIFAAGKMNKFTGGNWNAITVSNAISFKATDGSPGTWRPRPNGQVVRIRPTRAGDRILMAGYFTNINGDTNQGYYGITDVATGAVPAGIGPWTDSAGSNAKYQQAVNDLGDGRYLVGGSEHDFQMWDSQRTRLLDSTITKQGGDTQAIEIFGGDNSKVFFSCHCGDQVYVGTNNWTAPSGFRSVAPINLVGSVDATGSSFKYDTDWLPAGLKGAHGEGVWAIDKDSRGCVWVGGDLNKGAYSGNAATDWLGGFARFCPEDTTPPTTPSNFSATLNGTSVDLKWGASTDATGTVSYDVYRNDRVIATTYATSFSDTDVTGSARYTVRATDIRGNRSASPAPVTVNGPATKISTPVAFGSTWRYLDNGSDQGTAWRSEGFADSGWSSGAGRFGWGTTGNGTTLGATHPLTTYFRDTFSVPDASQVKVVSLRSKILMGAVYYVNGVEVGRYNMAPGKVTSTSTAAGYLTAAQENQIGTILVPGSLLHNGTNTVAVEVHQMRAGSARGWFDLEVSTFGAGGEANAPTAPVLSGVGNNPDVDLSWTPATDDTAVAGYVVARDGSTVAVVDPTLSTWSDTAVDAGVAHTYVLTAFDSYGNKTASNAVDVTPSANPNLLAYGSTWKWTFPAGGAPAGWNAVGFDDSTWATGAAEIGFGDNDEKTLMPVGATPRPITAYFRATVDVPDPSAFTTVLAELVRDDGAVIYVNGVEVGRDNMPAGAVTPTTGSATIISDRTAERTPVSISIPASAFRAGANTVAVEIHNSDAWSGDLSFDLKLTGRH